jgi:ADP-heptose:LPS heptosyltransferase
MSNSYNWQINISDRYYTQLVDSESASFEFYKNKILFEKVLGIEIPLDKPFIAPKKIVSNYNIEENYIVFFMGGRREYKKWSIDNFLKIGEYLLKHYNVKIVLSGSSSEHRINEDFIQRINSKQSVIETAGKTSLTDLLKILSEALLLISNDSGIVHSAASVDTPVIALANGTHYKRFLPYPTTINSNVKVFYPPQVYTNIKRGNISEIKYRSPFDINSIDFESVKAEAEKILSKGIKPKIKSGQTPP